MEASLPVNSADTPAPQEGGKDDAQFAKVMEVLKKFTAENGHVPSTGLLASLSGMTAATFGMHIARMQRNQPDKARQYFEEMCIPVPAPKPDKPRKKRDVSEELMAMPAEVLADPKASSEAEILAQVIGWVEHLTVDAAGRILAAAGAFRGCWDDLE